MFQLDALELANQLRQRLVNFAVDENFMRVPELSEVVREIWNGNPSEGGLISELWVEGAYPSESSTDTLYSLAKDGVFPIQLADALSHVVPPSRPLYSHQTSAIRTASDGNPAIVVTAPTGAGKTESFLLPALCRVWQARLDEGNERNPGVKCLILYPMNALVNDQVERLDAWLSGQELISFFHFTGESPENKKAADLDRTPPASVYRHRTRQQARGRETSQGQVIKSEAPSGPQPDILVTNYSMLEYMLCRPQDAVFFTESLQVLVLDEAHMYNGTLAGEIALLLRRLLERCRKRPEEILQVATSATLGGSTDDLRQFIGGIFTKDVEQVRHISGKQIRIDFLADEDAPARETAASDIVAENWPNLQTLNSDGDLTEDSLSCAMLANCLTVFVGKQATSLETHPAVFLHEILSRSPIMRRLEDLLWRNRGCGALTVDAVAEKLFPGQSQRREASVRLLQLGASARLKKGDYPLIPHRVHILARAPYGVAICINDQCSGPERPLPELGAILPDDSDKCIHCHCPMLSLRRCNNCGALGLAASIDSTNPVLYKRTARNGDKTHYLIPKSFEAFQATSAGLSQHMIGIDRKKLEIRAEHETRLNVYRPDSLSGRCPSCAAKSEWRNISAGNDLTISIVAETALGQMPQLPDPTRDFKPANGRRLLAFSDSRKDAARLGVKLSQQHETQLFRTAIVQAMSADKLTVEQEAELRGWKLIFRL